MRKQKLGTRNVLVLCAALFLISGGVGAQDINGKAGLGTGLAYGSVPFPGVGLELELGERVSILGGLGAHDRLLLSYGARVYFQERDRKWRFHASALRWLEGLGVYVGVDHDVGQPGRFIMMYGIGYGDVNLEGKIGATIGVGYRF